MENQLNFGFEEYPNLNVDFSQFLIQKNGMSKQIKGFDPYQTMIQKKKTDSEEIENKTSIQKWLEKDVKALETFCKDHGIVGFNAGKMPPLVALAFLKEKLGVIDEKFEERTPYRDHQKIKESKKILFG